MNRGLQGLEQANFENKFENFYRKLIYKPENSRWDKLIHIEIKFYINGKIRNLTKF